MFSTWNGLSLCDISPLRETEFLSTKGDISGGGDVLCPKNGSGFSRDYKIKVVLAYESGVSAVALSCQFEVHPNVIYNWAREYHKDPDKVVTSSTPQADPVDAAERRIVDPEHILGGLSLENDFLEFILKVMGVQTSPRNAIFST